MVREVFPPIGTEALYVDNAGSAGITPSVKPARWEAHMCWSLIRTHAGSLVIALLLCWGSSGWSIIPMMFLQAPLIISRLVSTFSATITSISIHITIWYCRSLDLNLFLQQVRPWWTSNQLLQPSTQAPWCSSSSSSRVSSSKISTHSAFGPHLRPSEWIQNQWQADKDVYIQTTLHWLNTLYNNGIYLTRLVLWTEWTGIWLVAPSWLPHLAFLYWLNSLHDSAICLRASPLYSDCISLYIFFFSMTPSIICITYQQEQQ